MFSTFSTGEKKKLFGGRQRSRNMENTKYLPRIFYPLQLGFFFSLSFFSQTRVYVCSFHPNYSRQCQGDSLEYPTLFKRNQKYSLSKEQNQWHKSTIVHSSFLSWTIPLYCVFIIPLKWVYRVGQVEHSHA